MNLTENEKRMVYQVESTCQAAILNEIAMNKRYAPNPEIRQTAESLDELVELIVDTVCSARKTIRIAGDDYPAEVVKSRFMKLDSSHIEYVLSSMQENTTYVRNIKKYLLAALYNAPSTISSYYTSLVNHDLYGGGERR